MPIESSFQPSKSAITAQLERIEQSQVLGRSKINKTLIKYLVNYYLDAIEKGERGKAPKEIEIATEALNKDNQFNPAEDASIRVYISNLRKKLEAYYQTEEGQKEVFHITIPPGGYGLVFIGATSLTQDTQSLIEQELLAEPSQIGLSSPDSISHTLTNSVDLTAGKPRATSNNKLVYLLAVLLMMSIFFNLWSASWLGNTDVRPADTIRTHSLWQPLFNNQKPNMIVIGDLFMLTERDPSTNRPRAIREFTINNQQDLQKYFAKYPYKRDVIGHSASAFLLKNSVFALQHILPLFEQPTKVTIRLVSNLTPADLRDYNLIYLGLYKSLGLLDAYFQGSNFQVIDVPASIQHRQTKERYAITGNLEQEYTDYGSFARFQGPSGNQVYVLAGFSDASVIQMAKYLTSSNKLSSAEFKQHYPQLLDANFELIFSASSFDRTDLDSKIVSSGELNIKAIWSMPN